MHMENQTDILLQKIDELYKADMPEHVYERTKLALLDYLGVTLAGARDMRERVQEYFAAAQPETGQFSAIGVSTKCTLKDAVFLNGLNAHALDFDDGSNAGIIHLGSPVFSVLLPLAQSCQADMEKLLRSAMIGYEMSYTLATSIQPKHKEMGYHATGTCGILGIAVAASYLLNYNEEERKRAVAFACVSASGMLQVLDDGSELKPYNVAKAALIGLVAVQMAKCSFRVHSDPIGGERGFLQMMAGDASIRVKSPKQEGKYAVERAYVKPYAACRYCHPAIDAAIQIQKNGKVRINDIEKILVKTYALAVNKHDHTIVQTVASAKMSIPYGVSVGLLYGKAGVEQYNEKYLHVAELEELIRKVSVEADQDMTDAFPQYTYATVVVWMKGAEKREITVSLPKGEPENPLPPDEFNKRFEELVVYAGKTAEAAMRIRECVIHKQDIGKLLAEFGETSLG